MKILLLSRSLTFTIRCSTVTHPRVPTVSTIAHLYKKTTSRFDLKNLLRFKTDSLIVCTQYLSVLAVSLTFNH